MNKTVLMRVLLCALGLIVAGWLQGCATATGQPFSKPQTPENGKGMVYLYRTGAFYAIAQSFQVYINGKNAGTLPNASYLALQLLPGLHSLTVAPGGTARSSARDIDVKAGTTTFYQYDFVTGPLANAFFIGASIEARDETAALAALQELKGASAQPKLDLNLSSLYAHLNDANAVPGLDDRGRAGYKEWLDKQKPRAFVLGGNGVWNSAWGTATSNPTDPKDPTERALRRCEQRGRGPCKVYAVDDTVVWQEPAR
jgi:hypothetical protein